MAGKIDARVAELGINIPEPRTPSANYIPFVQTGNLIFVSGQVSMAADGLIAGKLGEDVNVETGQQAARACGLNLLGQLKVACSGDLDRVKRVVKLGGFVNATPDFIGPPTVMNGASDLMVEIFGDAGRHARFAVATASLPQGAAVEVDGIFEVE
ncbi:MAG: RidA family protein [Alphaproteobacteria bacterium]|nr:RidA family protein [Alphaproteobacteria bacterium]